MNATIRAMIENEDWEALAELIEENLLGQRETYEYLTPDQIEKIEAARKTND